MIGAGACLVMLGLALLVVGGQNGRPLESLDRSLPSSYSNGCHLPPGKSEPLTCMSNLDSGVPTIYLIGDSHAAQWIPGFESAVPTNSMRFRYLTKSSCAFTMLALNADCDQWVSNVSQEILLNRPEMVIISNLTNGKYFNFYTEGSYTKLWLSGFRILLKEISPLTRVLIIEDSPYAPFDTSECLIGQSPTYCNFVFQESKLTAEIREFAVKNDFEYLSFNDRLCPQSLCKSGDSMINYYRDKHHVSVSLSKRFGSSFGNLFSSFDFSK